MVGNRTTSSGDDYWATGYTGDFYSVTLNFVPYRIQWYFNHEYSHNIYFEKNGSCKIDNYGNEIQYIVYCHSSNEIISSKVRLNTPLMYQSFIRVRLWKQNSSTNPYFIYQYLSITGKTCFSFL